MPDKFNELEQKAEQAGAEWDKISREMNELMYAIDNEQSEEKKKRLREKQRLLLQKMQDAEKREKEARRKLDAYMKSKG